MKVTRFEKDRYLLAFDDPHLTIARFEEIQKYWKDWWDRGADPSKPIMFGGEEVEFVDFTPTDDRLDEIEAKLDKLLEMLS